MILFFSDLFSILNGYFKKCMSLISSYFFPIPMAPIVKVDPVIQYIENKKVRFLSFLENPTRNENIPSLFYSKKPFLEEIQEVENEIEPVWKRRILFETTPRGNVLMLYDPFRFGFCYYTDTSSIPYAILNSVAMKYVMTYKCCDLFMDNEIPFESPLISIYKEEGRDKKKEGKETETEKEKKLRELLKDGPFIKRKKAIIEDKKESLVSSLVENKKENPAEFHRNKFLYLGKFHNYSFLKKENIKKPLFNKETDFVGQFKGVFNYKDYKKMYLNQ